jgi:hypothetical protein
MCAVVLLCLFDPGTEDTQGRCQLVGNAFDDFVFGCAVASSFHCQAGGAFTGFFLFLEGLGLGVLEYRRVSSKPDTPQSLINLFQKNVNH